MEQTYGVIGNTADFGSVILGSSPSRSTREKQKRLAVNSLDAFSFSGLLIYCRFSSICSLPNTCLALLVFSWTRLALILETEEAAPTLRYTPDCPTKNYGAGLTLMSLTGLRTNPSTSTLITKTPFGIFDKSKVCLCSPLAKRPAWKYRTLCPK